MPAPENDPPPGQMSDSADDIAADVSDFVADYLNDEDAGTVGSLSVYIARYPGAQEAVALEYLRLQGAVAPAASDSGNAAGEPGTDGEGDAGVFAGRYRLLRMLGSGGQGEVWLAEDESLGRKVALKLLKGVFVTEDRRMRFRREAESIARLDHPGLAQVHDADVDGARPFIAMRFVQGVDLATSFAQRSRPETSAALRIEPTVPWIPKSREELFSVLRFFERTARALHAAHEAGVLHRDIKPGNIMVTAEGQPVVLDFGLARDTSHDLPAGSTAQEERSSSDVLTREGDLFGTLSYMSPQQLRGETAHLDRRADVWALGVTLFEGLVGERPFSGATPLQLAESIEVARLVDPRSQNPTLTKDVGVVVGTALERSPERRYSSALAFAEDLRRIVEYEPIHARPAGPLLRLGRWCKREPAWAAALVVTLLALIAGLAASQFALAAQRRLLNRNRAAARASAVPALQEKTPAGALALGLEAVELDDTWLNRSTLYGPLLATTLIGECEMPTARVWDAHFLSENHLVAGSVGGTVAVFDVRDGGMVASVKLPADVHSLSLGSDPRRVFAGLGSGEVVGLRLPGSFPEPRIRIQRDRGTPPLPIDVEWTVSISDGPVGDLAAGDGTVYCIAAPTSVCALAAASGQEMARYSTDGDELARLELTQSGDRLVVADTVHRRGKAPGRSHLVRILDARTLGVVAVLDQGEDVIDFDVALAADVLATMTESGFVRVHDARTGAVLLATAELGPHHPRLSGAAIAVSPDGRRVGLGFDVREPESSEAALAPVSTLAVYDLDSLGDRDPSVWTARSVQERVMGIQFSSSGERVAVSDVSNHVRVFSSVDGSGERVHTERTRMTDLRFSPGETTLASFGIAKLVYLWRTRRSAEAFRLDPIVPGDPQPLVWGAFSGDGVCAAVLESGGRAGAFATPLPGEGDEGRGGVRSPEPGSLLYRLDGGEITGAGPLGSHSDTERARLVLSATGSVALWVDPESGRARVTELRGGTCLGETVVVGWSPGSMRSLDIVAQNLEGGPGGTALLVDAAGAAWVWDVRAGPVALRPARDRAGWQHGRILPGRGPGQRSADANSSFLLAGTLDEIVALVPGPSKPWEERAFEVPELPSTAPRGIRTWVLSPGGEELVLATTFGRIYRWAAATGVLLRAPSLRAPTDWLWCIDGDRVAVASAGPGTNKIIGGAGSVIPLAQHASIIRSMAVAAEAEAVVTGSEKSAVLVWDALTGSPLARTRLHQGPVRSVAAHGGRSTLRILSCAADGALVLPLDAVGAARRLAPRALSLNDESYVDTILGGGRSLFP